MERDELRQKIIEVMDKAKLGAMATVDGTEPRVRYMMMQRSGSGLELYSATFTQSRKVSQIKSNNKVQLIMGGDNSDMSAPYITISGTAEVIVDPVIKDQCWDEMLSQFFSGPDDPNYCVLKVNPENIEYMASGSFEPGVYKV